MNTSNNPHHTNPAQYPSMAAVIASPAPSLTLTTASNTQSRPQPPTRTRSSSLLHKNVLQRMRPLPFQYVFSLWHTKPGSSSTPTLLAPAVPDIAAFYKIYNNFPWDNLALQAGVHFFRTGVRPLWEDAENGDGGCWVVKVRKEGGRALRTWEELCLMVCGGELQAVVAKGTSFPLLFLSPSLPLQKQHLQRSMLRVCVMQQQ